MLGLSPIRLVIVAIVGLILLGPDKLPQVAKQAGSLWHSLRTLQQRVEEEIHEAVPDLPRSSDLMKFARSPVSLLNQLADKAQANDPANAVEPVVRESVVEGFTPPDDEDPADAKDPDRPPLAWGDPSLN